MMRFLALKLAQVPLKIINKIKSLMGTWPTKLYPNSIQTGVLLGVYSINSVHS